MRPTKALCAWCSAVGVVLTALPGSLCHECGTRWRVTFWEDMTSFEVLRACEKLGKTYEQLFGQAVRVKTFNLFSELVKADTEKLRLAFEVKLFDRLNDDIAKEIDGEVWTALEVGIKSAKTFWEKR